MKKIIYLVIAITAISLLAITQFSCNSEQEKKPMSQAELIALGKYIVFTGGCDDCHTPKIYTEMGPMPDTTRRLSGFPQGEILPAYDMKYAMPGNWVATEKNFGAWVGPWGISFASNLTPDNETGIGTLSEEMFIKTLREGKYMGVGRPLLPPMPWQVIGQKTDDDLKAIYAYLKSLKPIHNEIPQPVPPNKAQELLTSK